MVDQLMVWGRPSVAEVGPGEDRTLPVTPSAFLRILSVSEDTSSVKPDSSWSSWVVRSDSDPPMGIGPRYHHGVLRLAVVIPTLDEEELLAPVLSEGTRAADLVVVSDGGSRDRTVQLARTAGARVVREDRGRGGQLNRGAELALGEGAEALLFVHADTRLPDGAGEAVREALEADFVGGGFYVRFDDPRLVYRFGSRMMNLRTRISKTPLGDQAQFVRGSVFREMRGFREWPILEDLDFARRLKRRGSVAMLDPPVVTAARRYVRQGPVRTVARNWLIWTLFFLGVSPERLARLYGRAR